MGDLKSTGNIQSPKLNEGKCPISSYGRLRRQRNDSEKMRKTQLIRLEVKHQIGRQENSEERAETVYQQSKGDRRQRGKHKHVNMREASGRGA